MFTNLDFFKMFGDFPSKTLPLVGFFGSCEIARNLRIEVIETTSVFRWGGCQAAAFQDPEATTAPDMPRCSSKMMMEKSKGERNPPSTLAKSEGERVAFQT